MTQLGNGSEALLEMLRRRIGETDDCVVGLRDDLPVYGPPIRTDREPVKDHPEELVRALYVTHIVHDLGYRPESVSIEHRVRARVGRGQRDKYADIVISRLTSKHPAPYCVIELKTPEAWYAEKEAAWEEKLFGLVGFIDPRPSCLAYGTWRPDRQGATPVELELVDSVEWSTHVEWSRAAQPVQSDTIPANYGKPRKEPYVNGSAVKDLRREVGVTELAHLQRNLHNVLWGGGSETDSEVFNLITRLIFAKAYDETLTAPGRQYRFQVLDGEPVGVALSRITKLYREALVERLGYSVAEAAAVDVRVPGKGTDAQIRYAIERLERYHFTDLANSSSGQDMLGSFFEYIMRAGFKQSKGQFFTHANIAEFVVQALDLGEWSVARAARGNLPPKILDPSAGAGTFLIRAMDCIHARLTEYDQTQSGSHSPATQSVLANVIGGPRRNDWARESCFGMEINSDLGLTAQVNMFVHGDGSSSIFSGPENGDGLLPLSHYPHIAISPARTVPPYPQSVVDSFDAIITNPPFAVDFTDEQQDAHIATFTVAKRTSNSEEIFLERWFQFLSPGGRLGAVVPNSLLDSRSSTPGRDFLIKHFWIKAIVSLPSDAFYPHTMTKTSLLFAQKKTYDELARSYQMDAVQNLHANGTILFAQVGYLGYRRTAKSEITDLRNDLDHILPALKEARIWS